MHSDMMPSQPSARGADSGVSIKLQRLDELQALFYDGGKLGDVTSGMLFTAAASSPSEGPRR
jgi:hypothetical protein